MINLFSFTGKRVGVSILRASYLTYEAEKKRLSVADKKRLAVLMRTRKDKIDEAYIKILPKQNKEEILKDVSINKELEEETREEIKKEKLNPYKKQLENNKNYYQRNKEKIIERVKQNQAGKPKEEINRKRILYYLNGDENYINKIKEETMKKYNITYENGGWV